METPGLPRPNSQQDSIAMETPGLPRPNSQQRQNLRMVLMLLTLETCGRDRGREGVEHRSSCREHDSGRFAPSYSVKPRGSTESPLD